MALDSFLQFNDGGHAGAAVLNGETQDIEMKDLKPRPFDISTWTFGASQQVNVGSSSSGIGAGKVEFQPFKITKQVDTSSPFFFQTCAQGGHYEQCTLFVRKGGGAAARSGIIYLRFDFKMVFVTQINWSHDDTAPKEEVTFDYGALQVTYTRQKKDGSPAQPIKKSADAKSCGGEHNQAWSKMLNTTEFEVVS
ncbi:MAG TPA: type VI secretion system tube protein Hcp [Stellaceae bacterium]|jgi:type VI secretion system secreted protein Hcp|nr:type VI secretion system tube protein Hcp [Stellaceae bacterium]